MPATTAATTPATRLCSLRLTVPTCAAGVYLSPEYQEGSGCENTTETYNLTLFNNTGADGNFAMTYAGAWNTYGPASVFAAAGTSVGFTVNVDIPCGGTEDDATVTADGNGHSDVATLHTDVATTPEWNAENADLGAMPADVWAMGYAKTGDWLWIVAGVQAGAISQTTHYYDYGAGAWMTDGNIATTAVYRTSATVVDGVLYKLGGSIGSFTYTGEADKYGPPSSAIAQEPNLGRMDNVTAGYGGFAWSITGYGADGNVRKYDPLTNTWTVVGTPPPFGGSNYARSGCQMGDEVYLYGDATGAMTGLWEYNMTSGAWTQMAPGGTAPAQTAIWAPAWVADPDTGLCYMNGGATTPGTGDLKTTYVYDALNNTWLDPLPEMASARDFHAAFIFNRPADGHKMLCVAGGNSNNAGLSSTQCIDLTGCPGCENTMTCGAILAQPAMDPYGRIYVRWKVEAIDQYGAGVPLVAVDAWLWSPQGGPFARTRWTHNDGFAKFPWGSWYSGNWQIDVTNMTLAGYTFLDGPQCDGSGIWWASLRCGAPRRCGAL